ncbi:MULTISPECIES: resistance to Congo red protein [Thalassobaculum]|uniref:Holin-X, holin superfamily III n=1 Tax=Thalassobaculum litoreum DSM 18839 TaxID=1123362 RepID=A0A8G2EXZ8_9PROT|nr:MULTISPECIES: resistance to Congo red protein [Thalassobaculum]SDG39573.1 hypothetical protein SAMN05660686_04251 [Thalassobaculum litoreum DSM 18839]
MLSGLTAIARAEAALAFRRGLIAFAGTILLLGAVGLGLSAAVIETSTHVGLAASLGIWAAVTFLVSIGVLMIATGRRRHVDPAASGTAWRNLAGTPPPAGSGPVPGSASSTAVQDAYRLGEQLGSSISPVVVIGGLVALGLITGRQRR